MTFANFVKRYKSENDDTHAARKARYARKRRRWARKDLVRLNHSQKVIKRGISNHRIPVLIITFSEAITSIESESKP